MLMSMTDDNCNELCPECNVILLGESAICKCDVEWVLESAEGVFYIPME